RTRELSEPGGSGPFGEFFPFSRPEHSNRPCRRLPFVGTTIGLGCVIAALVTGNLWYVLAGLVAGYLLAWIGHFVFEKNRPATFTYPLYSFMGGWVIWRDILARPVEL